MKGWWREKGVGYRGRENGINQHNLNNSCQTILHTLELRYIFATVISRADTYLVCQSFPRRQHITPACPVESLT